MDFSWISDRDFLFQAARELLVTLGASEKDAAGLAEVPGLLSEASDRLAQADSEVTASAAEEPLGRLLTILVPAATQILAGLDRRGIDPALIAVSRPALGEAVADLERLEATGEWRGWDAGCVDDLIDRFLNDRDISGPAMGAGQREIWKIVSVLRDMPRPTIKRIFKVTSRPALTALITGFLRLFRVEEGPSFDSSPANYSKWDDPEPWD